MESCARHWGGAWQLFIQPLSPLAERCILSLLFTLFTNLTTPLWPVSVLAFRSLVHGPDSPFSCLARTPTDRAKHPKRANESWSRQTKVTPRRHSEFRTSNSEVCRVVNSSTGCDETRPKCRGRSLRQTAGRHSRQFNYDPRFENSSTSFFDDFLRSSKESAEAESQNWPC